MGIGSAHFAALSAQRQRDRLEAIRRLGSDEGSSSSEKAEGVGAQHPKPKSDRRKPAPKSAAHSMS